MNICEVEPPAPVAGSDPRPARRAALCEVFSGGRDGAGAGVVLAWLSGSQAPPPSGGRQAPGRGLLWVQDRMTAGETGGPSLNGLAAWDVRAGESGLIRVCARNATDLLWAMEEGLGCGALGAVVGEVWGTPAVLDFTATKRLVRRAEASGVPAYLLRVAGTPALSAAHERWRVAPLPSAPHPYDPEAPGDPCWMLELFRARWRRPGRWVGRYDRAAHRLDLAAPLADGALAAAAWHAADRYAADRYAADRRIASG